MDRKNPRMPVMGMGIDSLMELLGGGRDEEHEKIVNACSTMTNERLKAIAGDNKLAQQYVHKLWRSVMDALKEAEIETDSPELPNILRAVADAIELRERLHKELHAKRDAEQNKQDVIKPVTSEHN